MLLIDWIFVLAPLALVFGFAVYTNRFVKSVADFLSGGRVAGRYLLANAKGESESGVTNTMSRLEPVLISGFVLLFWNQIYYPLVIIVAISGFVIYRFRETRALTLAQFLEIRYSRAFRMFMGMLAFVSGILNYGIFPAVSARFFIYFLDLPQQVHLWHVPLSTFSLIMFGYLACTVVLVLVGGLATMMITCSLEGIVSQIIYVVIAIAIFYLVSWHQIVQTMSHAPPKQSLVNPFDTSQVKDFNIWFILMGIFIRFYTTMAMQNKQGFNSAAKTAHESRMGGILGEWRGYAKTLMLTMLGICALTYLNNPDFTKQALPIHAAIGEIKDTYLRSQMTIPIALRYLLPPGIKGLFCSIMVMGLLSGDGGHLHSWGSIFIQDVVLPLRKTAMTPRQHILVLRLAVIGVAAFAFIFSTFFTQTQYILFWMYATGAVFTGGAGAAIIGGLYWKKGTTPGAWAGVITGSGLSLLGIIGASYWPNFKSAMDDSFPAFGNHLSKAFWFSGSQTAFFASLLGALVYVVVSYVTCRHDFNLDRMLHRGLYAVEGDQKEPMPLRERLRMKNILKFDENFTFRDKLVSGSMFWYYMAMSVLCTVATVWNTMFHSWSNEGWAHYWLWIAIVIPGIIAVVTLFWFTVGGVMDMRSFFVALRTLKRDVRDDGRVVGHHNLADEPTRGFPDEVVSAKPGDGQADSNPAAVSR